MIKNKRAFVGAVAQAMRSASTVMRSIEPAGGASTGLDIQDGVDILLAADLLLDGAEIASRRIMSRVSPESRAMVALERATVKKND